MLFAVFDIIYINTVSNKIVQKILFNYKNIHKPIYFRRCLEETFLMSGDQEVKCLCIKNIKDVFNN